MASANYEIWIAKDNGQRLEMLDNVSAISYVKNINGQPGYFTLELQYELDQTLLTRDRQIQIYRRPVEGNLGLDYLGFLLRWKTFYDGDIVKTMLAGADQNILLDRRIVAYAAGTENAGVNTNADDAMKAVVTASLGSGATAGRDLSNYGFSVQANRSEGTVIEMNFAWQYVSNVLEKIHEASLKDTPEIFYGIGVTGVSQDGTINLEFQTFTGQPGQDRTWINNPDPVTFSREFGNLSNPSIEYDFSQEQNYIYAGGTGEGTERRIQEASNDSSIQVSQWGRTEGFINASSTADTDAGVLDIANGLLSLARPKQRFAANILDTAQSRYGLDWDVGDKITAIAFGRQFDGIVRKVRIARGGEGEIVEARIESEYTLL